MRHLSVLAVPIVAAATLVLGAAAHASAAILWVNAAGASHIPPGTNCANPGFATIQGAVSAANPGDTIRVCPGVYHENVVVATADLTIFSTAGATSTVVATPISTHVIEVRATGLTLRGLTIVAAGFADPDIGINMAIEGDTGARLLNNEVHAGRIGINLGCVSFGTIIANNVVIGQTEAGINIDTCEAPPFPGSHHNSIHHNTTCSTTATASIALGGSSNNNRINNNVATTISSFGTGNLIRLNTTRVAIVDNSGGGNTLQNNAVVPTICF